MHKTIHLTLSLLAWFAMLGTVNAGPKIADEDFFPNEVHAQTGHSAKQRQEADWRRARARADRAPILTPAEQKDPPKWRDQGGPKLPPVYW
jgi:hypothetical protein